MQVSTNKKLICIDWLIDWLIECWFTTTQSHVLKSWTHPRQGSCTWSFTNNMLVQTNNAARLLVRFVFFSCCCFYQDVNTRGRHSMMCTLWVGWQVIDSMKMEKRWRGGGWGKGESKESHRWVYWRVTQDYPSTDSPKTWWCRHGDTEQIHEKNGLKAL